LVDVVVPIDGGHVRCPSRVPWRALAPKRSPWFAEWTSATRGEQSLDAV
jgi:hypothetical protein